MQYYNYIKALHLIFVITWFAGLFYIPRLFVYQIEASQKPSPEKEILGKQLKIMAKRLWTIITWPSAILAISFGVALFILNPYLLQQGWMHVKLGFVVLLIAYHIKCHFLYMDLFPDFGCAFDYRHRIVFKPRSAASFKTFRNGIRKTQGLKCLSL